MRRMPIELDFPILKIRHEKQIFLDLIRDQTELQKSTKEFWSTNSSRLPILSSVAKKLFSVPASSAFVERYFSICGVVSSKRNQNIKSKNFICKTVLKLSFVNLSLILDSSFLFPHHCINATLKYFKCSGLSVECKCNTHTHTHTHTQHLVFFQVCLYRNKRQKLSHSFPLIVRHVQEYRALVRHGNKYKTFLDMLCLIIVHYQINIKMIDL
ncbi:hypothetical protein BpHYR1_040948 [Brachionus plicatilis]|uniref:HAT C-terminal dimerisation domain-containing protein n=1 Tax=Brachionus plicatilis TaxID=10195 RepID=A0A3M7TDE4_BRAPC|nr:hypothetical protein BpHYR1_040948 [Brachionus plicatilis]